jgi:hypothetical protein
MVGRLATALLHLGALARSGHIHAGDTLGGVRSFTAIMARDRVGHENSLCWQTMMVEREAAGSSRYGKMA